MAAVYVCRMEQAKIPVVLSLDRFADRKVRNAIAQLGKGLPASVIAVNGSIVTVKFEVDSGIYTLPSVTVAIAGAEYIRYPIQVGCLGVVFPCDTYIQNVNGLGTGTPDLTQPPNLSALTFFPIGNKHWSAPTDPNALELYGPNGVIVRDSGSKTVITLQPGGITILLGGACTINSGGHNVQVNGGGDVLAGTISLLHHTHQNNGAGQPQLAEAGDAAAADAPFPEAGAP